MRRSQRCANKLLHSIFVLCYHVRQCALRIQFFVLIQKCLDVLKAKLFLCAVCVIREWCGGSRLPQISHSLFFSIQFTISCKYAAHLSDGAYTTSQERPIVLSSNFLVERFLCFLAITPNSKVVQLTNQQVRTPYCCFYGSKVERNLRQFGLALLLANTTVLGRSSSIPREVYYFSYFVTST